MHEDEDDAFSVRDGEVTSTVEDEEVVAAPGTFVLVPPGVRHTFAIRGEVHAPAGFDRRFEAAQA